MRKKKGKIINFWTWFDKKHGSFLKKLLEEKKKKIIDDFFFYEIIRNPPNSNPPRHKKEPLKLIFNQEVID